MNFRSSDVFRHIIMNNNIIKESKDDKEIYYFLFKFPSQTIRYLALLLAYSYRKPLRQEGKGS